MNIFVFVDLEPLLLWTRILSGKTVLGAAKLYNYLSLLWLDLDCLSWTRSFLDTRSHDLSGNPRSSVLFIVLGKTLEMPSEQLVTRWKSHDGLEIQTWRHDLCTLIYVCAACCASLAGTRVAQSCCLAQFYGMVQNSALHELHVLKSS